MNGTIDTEPRTVPAAELHPVCFTYVRRKLRMVVDSEAHASQVHHALCSPIGMKADLLTVVWKASAGRLDRYHHAFPAHAVHRFFQPAPWRIQFTFDYEICQKGFVLRATLIRSMMEDMTMSGCLLNVVDKTIGDTFDSMRTALRNRLRQTSLISFQLAHVEHDHCAHA